MPLFKVIATTVYYALTESKDAAKKPGRVLDDLSGETTYSISTVKPGTKMPKEWPYDAYAYSEGVEGDDGDTDGVEQLLELSDVWPEAGDAVDVVEDDDEPSTSESEEEESEPEEAGEPSRVTTAHLPYPPSETLFSSYPPSAFVVLPNGLVSLGSGPGFMPGSTPGFMVAHNPAQSSPQPKQVEEPDAENDPDSTDPDAENEDAPSPVHGPPDMASAEVCVALKIQPSHILYQRVRELWAKDPSAELPDLVRAAAAEIKQSKKGKK